MTIEFQCECGRTLKAPEEYAGRKGKCPACQKWITVPETTSVLGTLTGSDGAGEEASLEQRGEEGSQQEALDEEEGTEGVESGVEELLQDLQQRRSWPRSPWFSILAVGIVILLVALIGFTVVRQKEQVSDSVVAVQEVALPSDKSQDEKVPLVETELKGEMDRVEETLPMKSLLTPEEEVTEETVAEIPELEEERTGQDVIEVQEEVEQKVAPFEERPESVKKPGPLPQVTQETVPETPKIEEKERGQEAVEVKENAELRITILEEKPEPMEKPGPLPGSYTVNMASFRERARADRFVRELKEKGLEAFCWEIDLPEKGKWHRVSVGSFPTLEYAKNFVAQKRLKENYSFFITKIPGA